MATDTEILSCTDFINNVRSPAVSPPESFSQKSLKFMTQTKRQREIFQSVVSVANYMRLQRKGDNMKCALFLILLNAFEN